MGQLINLFGQFGSQRSQPQSDRRPCCFRETASCSQACSSEGLTCRLFGANEAVFHMFQKLQFLLTHSQTASTGLAGPSMSQLDAA